VHFYHLHCRGKKIPEEKMAALYATVIKKNIYEEYDEEYGVKPIFILESDIFGSYKPKPQEYVSVNSGISSEAELPISSI
jgi:hypothetical protein